MRIAGQGLARNAGLGIIRERESMKFAHGSAFRRFSSILMKRLKKPVGGSANSMAAGRGVRVRRGVFSVNICSLEWNRNGV